ncbi:Dihydrofolate reductase [Promicromonospora umidemergens]|uniref:Dihydrofolate reductase family protein n=1 Tax=Promicromonospora umidemergens TaxID=629679 RepID=A0ABP8WJR5_9MICO|nr:dihydrofolate reductase family protein [Promicromonospora umidemergens]MCP2283777.1 Dihydrofolate reductase [Promicromonospora umidemergens]
MGTLSYFANMSADGYTVDTEGKFDWTDPTDEVLAFINEIEADVAVYVHGRRMYETMVYWETYEPGPDPEPHTSRYAEIWQGVEKVVASSSLPEEAITSARTRLVRDLQLGELRRIADCAPGVVSVGGPTVAAEPIRAGLVDEFRFFVYPEVLGGGLSALPPDARLSLRLVDTRTFASGCVYLRYVPR